MIRRHTLRLGGIAFGAALVLAACAENNAPQVDGGNRDGAAAASVLVDQSAAPRQGADGADDAARGDDAARADDAGGSRASSSATPATPAEIEAAAKAVKQRYKTVLHFGDSEVGFGGGLTKALQRRFEARGVRFFSNSLTSAGIQSYEKEERLPRMVKLYKPDLVLLNLGTNNLSVPHPDVLAPNIRNIVKKISGEGHDCIWIGPPHLRAAAKTEAAMTKVIEENVAPCKYFDSSLLELPMQSDRIHPTDKGGEIWAEQLWHFVLLGEVARGPLRDAGAK